MISMREKRRPDLGGWDTPNTSERNLGKLVQFETKSRAAGSGKPGRSSTAEILIFTGVRYERDMPATPTKPTASPRTKRKRG